jgi:hypothetical protein
VNLSQQCIFFFSLTQSILGSKLLQQTLKETAAAQDIPENLLCIPSAARKPLLLTCTLGIELANERLPS